MVTIRDVAAFADVSVSTASRALSGSGRIAIGTREKVRAAALSLGYQPNDLARSLHGKPTGTIAVLVPDITNPFFPELVTGIQLVANQHGGLLLLCQTFGNPATAVDELLNLRRKRCEGVILVGVQGGPDLAAAAGGMRIVTVDREADIPGASVVRTDHRRGGELATEHLIELGHEKIAHIAGPLSLQVSQARCEGYRSAMAHAGLVADDSLVVEGDFLETGGFDAIKQLRRRRQEFTAVFCGNDLTAIGAIRALDEVGLAVPEDVGVVGFDDIHLASYVRPALTTVHQPIRALGQRAAEMLLDPGLSTGPAVTEVLEVSVVRRQTTMPRTIQLKLREAETTTEEEGA